VFSSLRAKIPPVTGLQKGFSIPFPLTLKKEWDAGGNDFSLEQAFPKESLGPYVDF